MSQDPEEAGVDWGGTGYGTGDPNAHSFLDKLGDWMPLIVAGIFTAGTLQSMGLLPGASAADAAAIDANVAGGATDVAGASAGIGGAGGAAAGGAGAAGAAGAGIGAGAASGAAGAVGAKVLDPNLLAEITALLGGDALKALFTPRPHAFEGDVAPQHLLEEAHTALGNFAPGAIDKLSQPVDLSSIQPKPLPAYAGGGLPFPIAAPANANPMGTGGPARRRLPGAPIDLTGGTAGNPTGTGPDGGVFNQPPTDKNQPQRRTIDLGNPGNTFQPNSVGGGDASQAAGAVQLLLKALQHGQAA